MTKPQIFVSCGQRTPEEKLLASEICSAITEDGKFEFFFAEFQHSLVGLNENILNALQRAAGFVTVMHRRGDVYYGKSDDAALVRASVWIEQEIAIAAYIEQTTKKKLLIAPYIERGVGREGIRDLLHLNPTEFSSNDDVIADLKVRLRSWNVTPQDPTSDEDAFGKLALQTVLTSEPGIGRVVGLTPTLTNKGVRVKEYACTLDIPSALLRVWASTSYYVEVKSVRQGFRRFAVTEATKQNAPILKDQTLDLLSINVSIAEVPANELHGMLESGVVYLSAEMGEHSYSLEVTCSRLLHPLLFT